MIYFIIRPSTTSHLFFRHRNSHDQNENLNMADRKILKVLVIHGYRQSAKSSKEKTGAFRKGLKKYLECVFITAPNRIPGKDEDVDNEEYGWWFSKRDQQLSFNATEETTIDEGHDASVDLITKTVQEQGPFDGILGFSQGATMVAHICSLATEENSPFNFKFAILCAGFRSRSTAHERYYDKDLSIPSLFIFGDNDQVIEKGMSMQLSDMFTNKTIVNHAGGHFLPAGATERKQYQEFLTQFMV